MPDGSEDNCCKTEDSDYKQIAGVNGAVFVCNSAEMMMGLACTVDDEKSPGFEGSVKLVGVDDQIAVAALEGMIVIC